MLFEKIIGSSFYIKDKDKEEDKEDNEINPSLSESQNQAVRCVMGHKRNVLITGEAGTGKTFVIKEVIRRLELINKTYVVTATSGVASSNIDGITLHSFGGIGLGDNRRFTPLDYAKRILKNKNARKRYMVDVLIVDEISMVDGDYLELLGKVAQQVRHSLLPFGGLQLVLLGDFLQLPSQSKLQFYEHPQFKFLINEVCLLTTVFRQTDASFLKFLNAIRMGEVDEEVRRTLKELFSNTQRHRESGKDFIGLKLYAKIKDVDSANMRAYASNKNEPELLGVTFSVCTVKTKDVVVEKGRRDKLVLIESLSPDSAIYRNRLRELKPCKKRGRSDDPVPKYKLSDAQDAFLSSLRTKLAGSTMSIHPQDIDAMHEATIFLKDRSIQLPHLLKPDTRVMLRYNICVSYGLINGSRGILRHFVHKNEMILTTIRKMIEEENKDKDKDKDAELEDLKKNDTKLIEFLVREGEYKKDGDDDKKEGEYIYPVVQFDNGLTIMVPSVSIYTKLCGESEHLCTDGKEFTDFALCALHVPLVPAYAVTIHKAQGLTLPGGAAVEMGGIFTPGQFYVAASRVKTSKALQLMDFVPHVITADLRAVAFYTLLKQKVAETGKYVVDARIFQ
jgi:hypothetical protein